MSTTAAQIIETMPQRPFCPFYFCTEQTTVPLTQISDTYAPCPNLVHVSNVMISIQPTLNTGTLNVASAQCQPRG